MSYTEPLDVPGAPRAQVRKINFIAWMQLLMIIMIPAVGKAYMKLDEHGNRITAIESNKFTATDGADLRTWVHKNGIPAWHLDRINRMEDAITHLHEKLDVVLVEVRK